MVFFSKSRKGQSALEFVIIIGFALLFISALIVIFHNRISDMEDNREIVRVEQMYNLLLSEIDFAQQSRPFYNRSFYLPNDIGGQSYNISIFDNKDVVLEYEGREHVRFLSNDTRVVGQFNAKGKNFLFKPCVGCDVHVNVELFPFINFEGAPLYVDKVDMSSSTYKWAEDASTSTGAISEEDGKFNVNKLKENDPSLSEYPAALACEESTRGGYDDWYLPAVKQLSEIQNNRDTLEAFSGFHEFEDDTYWSSTEPNQPHAYLVNLDTGNTNAAAKPNDNLVRCVRDDN